MASLLVTSMLGFTCQAVRGFPTFAPCLEHVCAGGGGGCSKWCYISEGIIVYVLNVMLLVQYVGRRVVM